MKLYCLLRTIWYNITNPLTLLNGASFSGHEFHDAETEIEKNVTVFISHCHDCGKQEISWTRDYNFVAKVEGKLK
jgi:hypothetical protein